MFSTRFSRSVRSFLVSGTITNVAVNFTMNPGHTWVGDLDVVLKAPGGAPSHVIFSRTGGGVGFDSHFGTSAYTFADTAPAAPTWWTAAATSPIAAGSYRSSTAGEVAGGGANTLITPVFAGLGAGANGTWTLTFRIYVRVILERFQPQI